MSSRLFQQDFPFHLGTKTIGKPLIMGSLDRAAPAFLKSCDWLCLSLIFAQAVADRYSRQQTPAGLRKAIRWEPWNPDHYAGLARTPDHHWVVSWRLM
jgi:hypothetical protein